MRIQKQKQHTVRDGQAIGAEFFYRGAVKKLERIARFLRRARGAKMPPFGRGFVTRCCLVFFFCAPPAPRAQEATTVVEFEPFSVEGIGIEEGMMIEDLVRDYVKKIDRVLLVFPGVDEMIPRKDIDYILSGRIYAEDDGYILQLDVTDTRRDKKNSWTSSYRTSSDMALKVPTINYASLLGEAARAQGAGGDAGAAEDLRLEMILGRWRGDAGIEQVFFLRNGEARAYFSSGAGMEMRYRIEGRLLIVEQKSPNNARYYQGLSARAAAVLAENAEPLRWELSLYGRGQSLRGVVFETDADFDGAELTALRRGMSRPAEWVKSGR